MRVKAVAYDGTARIVEDVALAVRPGHLVAKPIYVYLGLTERIVSTGQELVAKPVVPGSSGIVRIIEDPVGLHLSLIHI